METTIKVRIENIRVTSDAHNTGYYYFDWFAVVNGKKKKGSYDSSYSSQSSSAIRGKLKRGYAIELAITQLFDF